MKNVLTLEYAIPLLPLSELFPLNKNILEYICYNIPIMSSSNCCLTFPKIHGDTFQYVGRRTMTSNSPIPWEGHLIWSLLFYPRPLFNGKDYLSFTALLNLRTMMMANWSPTLTMRTKMISNPCQPMLVPTAMKRIHCHLLTVCLLAPPLQPSPTAVWQRSRVRFPKRPKIIITQLPLKSLWSL